MVTLRALLATLLLPGFAVAQERLSFPTQDGGVVYADMYGKGERGVVLANGGRFNKESWKKQALELATAGFRALAIDFRGRGQSRGPQSKSGDDGAQYEKATGPKELVILDGSAHAQFIFATDQGERLMREILRFLSQP